MQSDHDYCDIPNVVRISEYKEAVISYIAGFVARAVAKKTPAMFLDFLTPLLLPNFFC